MSMSFLGLNLDRSFFLAQFGFSLAQVNYFRRLIPNPNNNRSKAKISLPSCLALRKYLDLYVLFGVKPHTGQDINCLGWVIPRTSNLLLMTSFKSYLQPEQIQDHSFLIFGIPKVLKPLCPFSG
jgi:hypothetical protein